MQLEFYRLAYCLMYNNEFKHSKNEEEEEFKQVFESAPSHGIRTLQEGLCQTYAIRHLPLVF